MKSAFRILTVLCACLVTLVAVCAGAQTAPDYDALVRQGNAQLQSGNNDAALRPARAAIKLNANRWEAYAVAGGALLNLQRYEEAADNFSEAIQHAPEAKLAGLRELRRKCLLAEAGAPATPAASASPAASATVTQAEIVLWKTIENSANPNDLQSYLQQYPNGAFTALAQRRLAELQQQAEDERENRRKQQERALERQRKQQEQELKAESERRMAEQEAKQHPTWIDPATGLMWARQDDGGHVDWKKAKNYCSNLKLGGYTTWRLATIDELAGIYDQTQNANNEHREDYIEHIKGYIQISGWIWSSSSHGWGEAWAFSFNLGERHDFRRYDAFGALCVRSSGE